MNPLQVQSQTKGYTAHKKNDDDVSFKNGGYDTNQEPYLSINLDNLVNLENECMYMGWSQWLEAHSVSDERSLKAENDRETYTDHLGQLRYVLTLEPVPHHVQDSPTAIFKDAESTGCMDAVFHIKSEPMRKDYVMADSLASATTTTTTTTVVRFILNWNKLWNFLECDVQDEFVDHAPLFKAIVDVLFHYNVFVFFKWLSIYNFTVVLIILNTFPIVSPTDLLLNLLLTVVFYFTYHFTYVMIKGYPVPVEKRRIPNDSTGQTSNASVPKYRAYQQQQKQPASGRLHAPTSGSENAGHERAGTNPGSIRETFDATSHSRWLRSEHTWKELFVELMKVSTTEMASTLRNKIKSITGKKMNVPPPTDIGPSDNFFSLSNVALKFLTRQNGMNESRFRLNSKAYRFVQLLIIIGYPAWNLISAYYYLISRLKICWGNYDILYCKYANISFFVSGFYLGWIINVIVFRLSCFIALVALSYQCEIGFLLVAAWLERYGGVRRLTAPRMNNIKSSTVTPSRTRAGSSSSTSSVSSPSAAGGTSKGYRARLGSTASSDAPDEIMIAGDMKSVNGEDDDDCSDPFIERLTTDSKEFYLFICHYMKKSGDIWTLGIVVLFLQSVYFMMFDSYDTIVYWKRENDYSRANIIMQCSIMLLLFMVYPFVSIARANSCTDSMKRMFNCADTSDFSAIGGKNAWIEFSEAVPATWRLLGIGVTWDLIYQSLVGVVTGAVTVGITLVSIGVIDLPKF